MGSSHAWIEHTGELELSVAADSREAVFVEAARALGELLAEHEREGPEGDGHGAQGAPSWTGAPHAPEPAGPAPQSRSLEIAASAPDGATLLAEWLSELVYHAEAEDLVPVGVERLDLTDTVLGATVAARPGTPSHLVKAVTYHRLELRGEDGDWSARVVLDV